MDRIASRQLGHLVAAVGSDLLSSPMTEAISAPWRILQPILTVLQGFLINDFGTMNS